MVKDNSGVEIAARFYRDAYDAYAAEKREGNESPEKLAYIAAQDHIMPLVCHLSKFGIDSNLPDYSARKEWLGEYEKKVSAKFLAAERMPQAEAVLEKFFNLAKVEKIFNFLNDPNALVKGPPAKDSWASKIITQMYQKDWFPEIGKN